MSSARPNSVFLLFCLYNHHSIQENKQKKKNYAKKNEEEEVPTTKENALKISSIMYTRTHRDTTHLHRNNKK